MGLLQGGFQRAIGLGAILALVSACGLQSLGDERGISAIGLGGGGGPLSSTPGADGSLAGGTATPGSTLGGNGTGLPGAPLTGTGTAGSAARGGTAGTGGSAATGSNPGAGGPSGLHGVATVGFIQVTGFSDLGKIVNAHIADMGDANAQANAMANYVNAHGGIAGKSMAPLVKAFNAQNANAATEQSICQYFQGASAFAVVLAGQIHYSTRDCYRQYGMIALEGSNYGFPGNFYSQRSPNEWSPIFPDYDQTERSLVSSLQAQNWFPASKKVGVAYWQDPPYQQVFDQTLKPALSAIGVSADPYGINNADVSSIEQGLHGAIQHFETSGITNVMFIGSDPLAPFFVVDAQAEHATFVYGLSSWDSPSYLMNNQAGQMGGAAGIGFFPEEDVNDSQYAWPAPGMESLCLSIYKAANLPDYNNWHDRQDSSYSTKQAISVCENSLLVQYVANREAGGLTVGNWAASAEHVGGALQMASPLQTYLAPGRHTGGAAFRRISWDGSCTCFRYVTGNLGFG